MRFYFRQIIFIALLAVLTLLTSADLYMDYIEGSSFLHLLVEAVLILLSFAGVVYLIYELLKHQKELAQVREQLHKTQAHLSESREHLRNAGRQYIQVIQQQFSDWELTPSEREVATLLLKGLSFDEIASVRQTKEKTVRQQATSIYRKSGLNGRHEFAAWFFEDFLQ
jgi:DNA-binding NarL/FixJ family response regulator